ncbi:SusC/RagA family TonB-linked outer membrane protein [Bacteroidia bacterium]|nr:SusC/RagA family TonB-linked outer membrane protein [Bacteroidia bacterium]
MLKNLQKTFINLTFVRGFLNNKKIRNFSINLIYHQHEKNIKQFCDSNALYCRHDARGGGVLPAQAESPQGVKIAVSGVVSDADGAIIGASVIEKGNSGNGIATDVDGRYTLQVSPNATLEISYLGYATQSVAVNGKTTVNVTLAQDAANLDEVVVVGYGTAKKSDLAGSVVRANLSTLQESPNVSLMQGLHGTTPGLNVGQVSKAGEDPSITIRGRNSINGTTGPLIVLDGIVFRGTMVDINPNDVESMDILKDASAAAIYGSQAANGVILITTKTGKTAQKPIISYNASYTAQSLANKKFVPQDLNGFLKKAGDAFLNNSRILDADGLPTTALNPDFNPLGGDLSGFQAAYDAGVNNNWWDDFTNATPYIQSHDVSVRGRSESSGYFMSFGYLDQQNLMANDTYERYNVRVNLDTRINSWLKVGTQSFFTFSDMSGSSPDLGQIVGMPPLYTPRDENGNLSSLYISLGNPYVSLASDNLDTRSHLSGTFFADIDIPFIKGLNYRLNVSENLITNKDFNYNEYSGTTMTSGGSASKANDSQYSWSVDNILNYTETFGKHTVNGTLVYGAEKRQYEYTNSGAKDFTNGALGYNDFSTGDASTRAASASAWQESSLYTMLRAGYTFDNRYIFTGTVRRDGFSGFGKNQKFGTFPSAAVAWRISEEDFMNPVTWVDNLKVRASYGQSGNRSLSRYQTLAKLATSTAAAGGYISNLGEIVTGQYIDRLANADLKWEATTAFNVGLDFAALNNRLFGTLDYYNSKTSNLLYDINIPSMNTVGIISSNIGEIANTGFEASITGTPVKTTDFRWDITFNYSINRNEVVSITGVDADGDGIEDDLVANSIFIGKPYGVRYNYRTDGIWQLEDARQGLIPAGYQYGDYRIVDLNPAEDGTYKIDADNDREIIGYNDPSYRFSVQNTFGYKNFELKAFVNSIQGGSEYYYGQPASNLNGGRSDIYKYNSFAYDYWTPENPNARYRKVGAGGSGASTSPYRQRSFVRLQDVTLSYTLPKSLLQKAGIGLAKVYVTGNNLYTWTDWDGWDPETGTGLDPTAYPVLRSFSVGLNLEF